MLYSRRKQEDRLHFDRNNRQPGLKNELAAAMCSGDFDKISKIKDIAHSRAIAAIITSVARQSIRATIEEDKINKIINHQKSHEVV